MDWVACMPLPTNIILERNIDHHIVKVGGVSYR
jgi:hypothetical protein